MNKRRRNRRNKSSGTVPPASTDTLAAPIVAWPIDDWAKAMQCCRATVYNLVNRGELELIKVGRLSRVRPGPSEYLDRKAAERV
jgi:hypothetical protein